MEWNPVETRGRGCPKKRWLVGMDKDLRSLGIMNWGTFAGDRKLWCKIVEEAKGHTVLYCQRKKKKKNDCCLKQISGLSYLGCYISYDKG